MISNAAGTCKGSKFNCKLRTRMHKERKKVAAIASLEQRKFPIVPQPYKSSDSCSHTK
jgi:hypothetical protein